MSLENAKAFMERMKNDEDFRKKVTELKDSDERMVYVKKAGFDFTKEDVELARAELTDDEVEGVVGGGDTWITTFLNLFANFTQDQNVRDKIIQNYR